jgi:hypothetical protein
VLEVESYYRAISLSTQTALRDIIGTHTLEQMLCQRETLGRALQETLDRKTNPWGITVQSVEIRDVIIPESLQDAMSKQAQAERERQARIILGTAETEIAAKFVEAARPLPEQPGGGAPAGDEHALRGPAREGLDHRGAVVGGGVDEPGRDRRPVRSRRQRSRPGTAGGAARDVS